MHSNVSLHFDNKIVLTRLSRGINKDNNSNSLVFDRQVIPYNIKIETQVHVGPYQNQGYSDFGDSFNNNR